VPFFINPLVSWFYARFVERGCGLATSGFPRVLGIGDNNSANQNFLLLGNNGVGYMAQHWGPSIVSSTLAAVPAFGNVVELLGFLNTDGSVTIRQSLTGAADTVAATSPAQALTGAWAQNTLYIGSGPNGSTPGSTLISRFVVGLGAGTTVQQISDVRGIP